MISIPNTDVMNYMSLSDLGVMLLCVYIDEERIRVCLKWVRVPYN